MFERRDISLRVSAEQSHAVATPNGHEPPVAVFAMRSPEPLPISAVIVTPSADGQEAEVVDLRQPDSGYVAPLAS